MRHIPTINQVKQSYADRVTKAVQTALVKCKDEMEVEIVLFYKALAEKPRKTTLKDLRFATDIVESLAERT